MRKPQLAAIALGTGLALTGCGPSTIADVEPDTPRAEKDEIFAAYIRDTYGEDYPAVTETADTFNQDVLRICSALDDGINASTLDSGLGFDQHADEDKAVLLDIVYQGTRVYCPRHTDSVEWMNAQGTQ